MICRSNDMSLMVAEAILNEYGRKEHMHIGR
jgi:hypothetical protein